MNDFCTPESNGSPTWGLFDVFVWKLVPARFGGGRGHIQRFKDTWLIHNKQFIKASAAKYLLPVELLAGVCWIETGGDPNSADRAAFEFRAFDHWGNLPTVITPPPAKTSFGWVSVQLRTAAVTLGLNPDDMSISELRSLANCLEQDVYNIDLAAKHLRLLADYDKFTSIGMDEVRIIGARYNRGTNPSIEKIKEDTSYGDFIVKRWNFFGQLVR
ncbi:hypothetical protein ALP86_05214 [Pseudomonas amygdali pv. mori]|uniref:Transglycosylase SLT domain-containing protein n=1 Tax=Pseudomonas amygdali pv. mori TaxID=34065 RepID=A0A3M4UT59_PSEA0|nr:MULTISPECIES: hypothetical protein [Pseudomonas syringae group]MBI6843848.1 hypothetical protein [Pseudomonas syringae]RMM27255.1 hypothetical protein ALQ81_04941 [Pseudomonas syringae pv. pisi]RMQ36640.1 hypothetical protein ALQ05_05269 [Pseudomonas amygdali pv. mori]RMR42854.1 hypothetical protein ALP86_05214 [Pseudomonas amygdali pv. mori]